MVSIDRGPSLQVVFKKGFTVPRGNKLTNQLYAYTTGAGAEFKICNITYQKATCSLSFI